MAAADPLISKRLGDYNIVALLGQGGMARVYRGYDARLDRYAAVKVTEAQVVPEADQMDYFKRFQSEARAIARLQHPNIVGIYQFGQAEGVYYMAMAFIEGRDLRTVLRNHSRSGTRMAYAEILRVVRDIGAALDYAHQHGVIHRDVKPSNIMVTPDGQAILTDFGLALHVPEGTIGNTFGTAHYIAPEQAVSSAQAVPQSDIYSLGVVLYEMLTNHLPFDDPSAMVVAMKHLMEPPPAPSTIYPALPPALDAVVMKALAKEPASRYRSGQEFAQALQAALAAAASLGGDAADQETVVDRPDAPPALTSALPPLPIPARRRPQRWGVFAALALLLIVTVAALAGTQPPSEPAVSASTPVSTTLATTVMPSPSQPTQSAVSSAATASADALAVSAPSPAAATAAAPDAAIVLKYDSQSLVLWNRSERTVDVSGLTFVQTTAKGQQLVYESNRWAGGSRPVNALPAGDCFQVYRDDLPDVDKPDYCGRRHAWARVSFIRWFWTSDDPQARFEVRRGATVLATCAIGEQTCAFDPG